MPSRRSFLAFFGATAAGAGFFGFHHRWHPPMTGPTSTATATATPSASALAAPSATPSATASATATPTAEPTAAATTPAVTSSMPVGTVVSNGTTWKQVYAEDFTTDAAVGSIESVYPQMGYYQGGKDTSGYGYYAPNQVLSVSNSMLDFHMHSINGTPVGAAVLPDNYAPHVHARVSIRYRADPTTGYKFVGILWPSSNIWNQGEIDWPEGDLAGRARPASAIAGTYGQGKGGNPIFLPPTDMFAATDQTAFHVATTEWTADAVRFYWDDTLIATVTQGVPSQPMRVTMQAETWVNEGAPSPSSDGHIQIDWITIYEAA